MMFKCKDCPDRAASCHVTCEKYAESLKEHEKERTGGEFQKYGIF